MARRPRIVVAGGLYHVYNRVASGEAVFSDGNEARDFVELIRYVKKRDSWKVLAWCVMSSHFHIVLRTATVPLWRGMHGVQNQYSRRSHSRSGRTGSMWQGRYHAKYIGDPAYLSQLVVYVHRNPVRAGVVKSASDYRFSGHWETIQRTRTPLIDVDEMLLCFAPIRRIARDAYLCAINASAELTSGDTGWHPFNAQPDDEFVTDSASPKVDFLGRSTEAVRPQLEAALFVRLVCGVAGIDADRLASRARDRETALARRLVVTLGVERWRQCGTDLAVVLAKNPDVVSWWVGEGARLRSEDDRFADELDSLDRQLAMVLRDGSRNQRTD